MYKLQRKIKCWSGNYWTTDNEWYEWEDINEQPFTNCDMACERAIQIANNPFVLGIRVVNVNNGPLKEYYYFGGQVKERAL